MQFSAVSVSCMISGVLLVNLGTPDSPSVPDVRKYLREFLMDGRVIDIPWIPRFLLVNGIIAPFRAPKSARVYKKVWLEEGSPLKVYGNQLVEKVQRELGPEFMVRLGMRYQSPSIESGLDEMRKAGVSRIIVVPLFPQYASATSGSIVERVSQHISTWQTIPEIQMSGTFFQASFFLDLLANRIRSFLQTHSVDQVLFSYHGLPERQIRKGDMGNSCLKGDCCGTLHSGNALCYRAQCFETSRLLARKAGIPESGFTTAFQSRLGRDPWIKPYTEDIIKEWPTKGIKRVLALSPSFVADCLETTEEIGMEYKEVFEHAGGESWHLLDCLNADSDWAAGLAGWIRKFRVLQEQDIPDPQQA